MNKRYLSALIAAGGLASLLTTTHSLADPVVIEQNSKLMGHDLSVKQDYQSVPSGNGLSTTTQIKFLGNGKGKPLIDASVEFDPNLSSADGGANGGAGGGADPSASPAATPNPLDPLQVLLGNVKHDFYIKGIRVWSGRGTYENGAYGYEGGVAPTQVAIPVFTYPVGPLVLEVDAGVEFEAMLAASLKPGLSIPIQDSNVLASLKAQAAVSGFVEGAARILILRAGVGGALNLVDGSASVGALIFFQGKPPELTYDGRVSILSGRIYAFVDTNIFFGKWKKLINYNLYAWKGKCWAFGAHSCDQN